MPFAVACADYVEVGLKEGADRENGDATAMCVLKKVNKSKFGLFRWICCGSAGLNR